MTRSVGGELAGRITRFWESVADLAAADSELQELRNGCETLHARFSPPAEVGIRPVNAGGVPSFLLTPGPERPATLLYLHGGGYVMGSAFGYRPLAGALAAATGATTVLPEFRLAPEHPFPAALEDAMRAYLWIVDQGTPPHQVTLAGDSSGAGLALSLMISLKQRELPMPGGAMLLSPGVDLSFAAFEQWPTGEAQPVMTVELLRRCAGFYLGGHPPDDPVLAPLSTDLTGLPPLLVQAGTGDPFLGDAHRLTDHARAHGVSVRLQLFPVATHVFFVADAAPPGTYGVWVNGERFSTIWSSVSACLTTPSESHTAIARQATTGASRGSSPKSASARVASSQTASEYFPEIICHSLPFRDC